MVRDLSRLLRPRSVAVSEARGRDEFDALGTSGGDDGPIRAV